MSPGRGPIAAALALLLAAPAAPAAPRADPARLRALGEEFVAHRRTSVAYLATRSGALPDGPLAPSLSPAALAREQAWMRTFHAHLAALPDDAGGDGPAPERALLEAAVARERVELEVIRPFQRDPGTYLDLLAGAVESALDPAQSSVCGRLQRAARRLTETPEVLRAARLNLTEAPRTLIELAVERCAGVLRFHREDVGRRTAGCRSARLQADLAQADSLAVRAIEEFRSYLEIDLLAAAEDAPALGVEGSRRILHATLAEDPGPIEALLEAADDLVDARLAALDSLEAARVETGGPAPPDSLGPVGLAGAGGTAAVTAAIGRVEAFLVGRELVTLPDRTALGVREAPPFRRSEAVALARSRIAASPPGPPAWLELAPSGPAGAGPERPGWIDRPELDLAVAHEGLPGRHLRALAVRGGWPRLERALLETWDGRDWGQHAEAMLLEEGYGGTEPRQRLAGARRALRHAGRAFAALAIHAGGMTPEEAAGMLEARCRLAPDEARREARWAAADPARMGYTSGARRLRELQDEARRRLGPRYRTRAFNDAVLRCGASPPGIVRERLWRELAEATDAPPPGARR